VEAELAAATKIQSNRRKTSRKPNCSNPKVSLSPEKYVLNPFITKTKGARSSCSQSKGRKD